MWGLLPCCFTLKAYELYGFENSINNFVSLSILLVYLTKFFWWEAGYMCTMDIILDRAGYYICWGCLVFIPGLYASFGYYLASHPIALGYPCALSILLAGLSCVSTNYIADWQRQDVRAKDGNTTIWGRKPDIIRAKYRTAQGMYHSMYIYSILSVLDIHTRLHLWVRPVTFSHLTLLIEWQKPVYTVNNALLSSQLL